MRMWFRRQNTSQRTGRPTKSDREAADRRAAASEEALAHGRLPAYVLERIRKQVQHELPWTSDLSVNEWSILRRYQLRPLGQVMGSSYYRIAYRTGPNYFTGSYDLTDQEQALYDGRAKALSRLQAEARAFGANAVVGVRIALRHAEEGSQLEFTAFGTAVRLEGFEASDEPVLCTVSGQDLIKLLEAGSLPVGLVAGVAVFYQYSTRRDMWQAGGYWNQEMPIFTESVYHVRRRAMNHIRSQLNALGAHGLLGQDTHLNVQEIEVERGENDRRVDHIVQFIVIGTAVMQLAHPLPLNIRLSLNLGSS